MQSGDGGTDVGTHHAGQQDRVAVEHDDLSTPAERRGRHLGAEEATAEDADPASGLQPLAQPVAVGQGADVVDPVPLDAGQPARPATGGEHDEVGGDRAAVGEEHRTDVGGDPLHRAAGPQGDVLSFAPGRVEQPEAVVPALAESLLGQVRALVRAGRLVTDDDDGTGKAATAQRAGGGGGDVAGADDDESGFSHGAQLASAPAGCVEDSLLVAFRGVTGSGATRIAPSSVTCTA